MGGRWAIRKLQEAATGEVGPGCRESHLARGVRPPALMPIPGLGEVARLGAQVGVVLRALSMWAPLVYVVVGEMAVR